MTHEYGKQKYVTDGRLETKSASKSMGDRNYNPNFSQVHKKTSFAMSFKVQKHSETIQPDQSALKSAKKETNAEKLLRKVQDDEKAFKKELARR